MDLKEETILGDELNRHWYYVSKGRVLLRLLRGQRFDEVLDIGAGSGIFSRQLLDAGVCERAVCVDISYQEERAERHNGRQLRFLRAVEEVSQPLVLMMDVLEHVDDDLSLLRRYTESMPRQGRILATVPAFQFLWSGHDVFLEHRRRYTLAQLEDLLRRAGLEILAGRYFFGLLFPVAAASRLANRLKMRGGLTAPRSALRPYSPWVNASLILVHDIERIGLLPFNRLAGLSAVCLARKN
jgi:hypothetical protein